MAQENSRASLGHGGGRSACLEAAALFLCDLVVSSIPWCCSQLCHMLDPSVSCRERLAAYGRLRAPQRMGCACCCSQCWGEESFHERMRQAVFRKVDGDHLWHRNSRRLVKFWRTGKPRITHPAQPGMHRDVGQLLYRGMSLYNKNDFIYE